MTRRILVPIDLAHEASFDIVFPAIKALARAHDAALYLMTVIPDDLTAWPYIPHSFVEDSRKQAEAQLTEIADMDLPDDIEWHSQALVGSVAPTIVRHAKEVGAGLIAITSHDPKALDILLGGVADRVLRRAPCSVLVLRAAGGWQWNN